MPSAISFGDFIPLGEPLRLEAEASPLAFLPNSGNWGAAFTAEATRRFLAAHAIRFRELPALGPMQLARGLIQRETLLLGGGGAWSDRYPGGQRLAARAALFLVHRGFLWVIP